MVTGTRVVGFRVVGSRAVDALDRLTGLPGAPLVGRAQLSDPHNADERAFAQGGLMVREAVGAVGQSGAPW